MGNGNGKTGAAPPITAEQYADICDVIERIGLRLPPPGEDDDYKHASNEARRATQRIIEILGLDWEGPRA